MNLALENSQSQNQYTEITEKVKNSLVTLHGKLIQDKNLPQSVSFDDGEIIAKFLDEETIQLSITYRDDILLNLVLHDHKFSFYRMGIDDYYFDEKGTSRIYKEIENSLHLLIPNFKEIVEARKN